MAKTIQRKAKTKAKAKVRPQPQRANMALDVPAKAYAQLLAHPCTAALAHPVYAGSEGGILVRVESSFSVLGGVTGDVGGFVHWTPGAIGPNNIELLNGSGAGSTTLMPANTRTDAPGKSFLTDNASTTRCVAACMQVTYLGTELNRGGVVMLGRTQGGLIDSGGNYSPAGIEQTLEHFERMPASTLELTWVPADMDQSFTDPNTTTPSVEKDRKSSLTCAYYGVGANSPIRIRLVAIYEWQPKVGYGLSTPSDSRARSRYSLDDVLNFVQTATNVVHRISGAYTRTTRLLAM